MLSSQNPRLAPRTSFKYGRSGKADNVFHIVRSIANTYRGDITAAEKKAYIAAVLCIYSLGRNCATVTNDMLGITKAPSKLNPTSYPGAKTRYDDFVAVHIKNSLTIHGTVSKDGHRIQTSDLIAWTGQLLIVAPLFHLGV